MTVQSRARRCGTCCAWCSATTSSVWSSVLKPQLNLHCHCGSAQGRSTPRSTRPGGIDVGGRHGDGLVTEAGLLQSNASPSCFLLLELQIRIGKVSFQGIKNRRNPNRGFLFLGSRRNRPELGTCGKKSWDYGDSGLISRN